MIRTINLFSALLLFSHSSIALSEAITADEIIHKSLRAHYYAGNDIRASVNMELINKSGKKRKRSLVMVRKNTDNGGQQKYFMVFTQPSDVKNTTFMVWKHQNKADDRWIFIPAIRLVKRIAADDKHASFVGSDFSYEDVSGRNPASEKHQLIKEENFKGKQVYVVESTPKDAKSLYKRRTTWVDKVTWLPIKEEVYDLHNKLSKTFTANAIENISSIWTITDRTMKNEQSGHQTNVKWSKIQYNQKVKDAIFRERYLRKPPRMYTK